MSLESACPTVSSQYRVAAIIITLSASGMLPTPGGRNEWLYSNRLYPSSGLCLATTHQGQTIKHYVFTNSE